MFTGLEIKDLRQKLGITQVEMAELLQSAQEDQAMGPSVQTIRYWEQNPHKTIQSKHNRIIQSAIGELDVRNEVIVWEGFEGKVKSNLAKIPFLRDAVQMWFFAKDPKSDLTAKVIAIGALAYFIMPLDAIPDIVPILGFTDDAGIIVAALGSMKKHITEEHEYSTEKWLNKL